MKQQRPNPRNSHRVERLNELLRQIIAEELEQIDDDELGIVTITAVQTDRDLTHASVFVSSLSGLDDEALLSGLEEHRRSIQKAIGQQARLRRTPPLHFKTDETLRAADRIETILRDIEDGG